MSQTPNLPPRPELVDEEAMIREAIERSKETVKEDEIRRRHKWGMGYESMPDIGQQQIVATGKSSPPSAAVARARPRPGETARTPVLDSPDATAWKPLQMRPAGSLMSPQVPQAASNTPRTATSMLQKPAASEDNYSSVGTLSRTPPPAARTEGTTPLITFSPTVRSDPFDFDLISLDPLRQMTVPEVAPSRPSKIEICGQAGAQVVPDGPVRTELVTTGVHQQGAMQRNFTPSPNFMIPQSPAFPFNQSSPLASPTTTQKVLPWPQKYTFSSTSDPGYSALANVAPSSSVLYQTLTPGNHAQPVTNENNYDDDIVRQRNQQQPEMDEANVDDLMDFSDNEEHDYMTLESFDPLSLHHKPNVTSSTSARDAHRPKPEPVGEGQSVTEDEIQDPFSVNDLTRVMEIKRQKYAQEMQKRQMELQQQQEKEEKQKQQQKSKDVPPSRPPPSRQSSCRVSNMSKDKASRRLLRLESAYETLQPFIETADEEIRSFCDMVKSLKAEHSSDGHQGLVTSPRLAHALYTDMTVKVVVDTEFTPDPLTFTCDLNSIVEHVISHVLLSLADNLNSTSTDQFVLKVAGLAEYLENDVRLSDYEYVQHCLKMDRDIKFVILNRLDAKDALSRTPQDDLQPVFVPKPRDDDKVVRITRDKLNILLETFYNEVEKLREHALKKGLRDCKTGAVVQSVKAVSATLCGVETVELQRTVQRLQAITIPEHTLRPASPTSADAFTYITHEGESADVVDMDEKSAELYNQLDQLHTALEELTKAVKALIELYCRTFHTDFRLQSSMNFKKDEKRPIYSVHETLLVHMASVHRLPIKWLQNFSEFKVLCSLYHGGKRLCEEGCTLASARKSSSFPDTVIWDEWIEFSEVPLCHLARETRLCVSLVGVKLLADKQGNQVRRVNTALAWGAMQLFAHTFEMSQGSQLLGLWPGDQADPLGTSLSNVVHHNSVLLQLNLPDFEFDITFPAITEPTHCRKQDFGSLHPGDQQRLKELIAKNPIAPLNADEFELLWEKRFYLCDFPEALAKVMRAAPRWDWANLTSIYTMVQNWSALESTQSLQLFLPFFADSHVRTVAVSWLQQLPVDEVGDFLPQLVQALKYESYHNSSLARYLLECSIDNIRFAHQLYWLLKEAAEDPRYRKRYQLVFGALMSVVGEAVRNEFKRQEDLVKMLSAIAEKVKAGKDKDAILHRELENMWDFLQQDPVRLPLNPSMQIKGVDVKTCSFFPSNTFPLKLVMKNVDAKCEPIYSMFKVGDDLRQDMLTMQLVRLMDKIWLREGLDLRIITFKCQATGNLRGMVELITDSETLRKIQVKYGVTGSFKNQPISEWLQRQNPTELDYQKAVDNFLFSCAGYCVATYILGICDRHNDNIMIKNSGHMFHIDFGKFLGDSQMFGNIKRDRVPFVLTSDMAYVINGGEKQSSRFQEFVDLCCRAFNIIRKHADLLTNVFSLMVRSGIPNVNEHATRYVEQALLPDRNDIQATAAFTRMIQESLKSFSTQLNFFIHNLAQLKHSGHQEGVLLSFSPKTYSIATDGAISDLCLYGYQKRYSPEKFYIFVIQIHRVNQTVPSYVFRRYSEFEEFHHKLVMMFPLARLPSLSGRVYLGRTHVHSVAESRKAELNRFLQQLLRLSTEIAEHDIVYTFFHPMLRDEQDMDKCNIQKLREPSTSPKDKSPSMRPIKGQIKLQIFHKDHTLTVVVIHVKDLGDGSGGPPDPYVKTYLLPDPSKITKQKTKIVKNSFNPTFNELLQYRMNRDQTKMRLLQVTVWSYDSLSENEFLGGLHLRLADIDLDSETPSWYPLSALHHVTSA